MLGLCAESLMLVLLWPFLRRPPERREHRKALTMENEMDWSEKVRKFQYQYANDSCMYCAECGEEGHAHHAVWASVDLEGFIDSFWHLVDAIGMDEAKAERPDIVRYINL